MSKSVDIKVPDIGDFSEVEVIEILLNPGDQVNQEDPIITLESDKASMEIPSPVTGVLQKISVSVGDKVSEGAIIAVVESTNESTVVERDSLNSGEQSEGDGEADARALPDNPPQSSPDFIAATMSDADIYAEVVVLGSGPGGYTAAFRAADLGLDTLMIERYPTLGGVCLNVGCIPSKALLHAAKILDESREFAEHGIQFSAPKIDLDKLRGWKDSVVSKLTGGLTVLADKRKVKVIHAAAKFVDSKHIQVTAQDGTRQIVGFEKCIIAAGSEPLKLPFISPELYQDSRVIDSTGALDLTDIPQSLLVIGGGIIGLEMATVYHALGSEITVVEMLPGLMAGADKDIVRPFHNRVKKRYEGILLETRVTAVEAFEAGVKVTFDGKNAPAKPSVKTLNQPVYFDRILVAVGRVPNGKLLDADKAGVRVDDAGFIAVDNQQKTNVAHIFALGDIVGQPMLAHKAVHEGKVAAEVCAGMKSFFDARVIPSVAYTDPEVAWVGVTETEAKSQGINYAKGSFPWAANGRSLSLGRDEGLTKLLFDAETNKVIGGGIVGPNAGDLIAEVALAIETHCDAADIALTIHPHPTLAETVAMAAEVFEGTITDLYLPRKNK